MRALAIFLVLVIFTVRLFAQSGSSVPRLRETSVYCGASSQLLAHIGVRQAIRDEIIGEIAFGGFPQYSQEVRDLFGHTLGASLVPHATRLNGKGIFYSLLYTFISEYVFSTRGDFHHVITGNVGYLTQNVEGWCVSARGGVGFMLSNSRTVFGATYFYTQQFHPWLNLEIAVGYAL